MVSLDYIARSALRRDTAVARAFLRALGIPVREPVRPGCVVSAGLDPRYAGVRECMANRRSPMDGA